MQPLAFTLKVSSFRWKDNVSESKSNETRKDTSNVVFIVMCFSLSISVRAPRNPRWTRTINQEGGCARVATSLVWEPVEVVWPGSTTKCLYSKRDCNALKIRLLFFFGFFLTGRDEGCIDLVPNVIGTWELCDDEATHVVECRLKQKSTTTITQQLWEEKSLSVWFECFDLCIVWCASRSSQSSGSARPKGRPDINGPTSLGQITWQKKNKRELLLASMKKTKQQKRDVISLFFFFCSHGRRTYTTALPPTLSMCSLFRFVVGRWGSSNGPAWPCHLTVYFSLSLF